MSNQGRINQYRCHACGGTITTIDREHGVTPMFLNCRVLTGCRGRMVSAMYRVDQALIPDHEWYKPTGKVAHHLEDHVRSGGLLLRKIVTLPQSPERRWFGR